MYIVKYDIVKVTIYAIYIYSQDTIQWSGISK